MDLPSQQREDRFDQLLAALTSAGIPGVTWKPGRSVHAQPSVNVRAKSQDTETQIEVVWLGSGDWRKYVPNPADDAAYCVTLVRLNKHNICFPDEPIGATTDLSV